MMRLPIDIQKPILFILIVISLCLPGCSEKTKGNYEDELVVVADCQEYHFEIDSLPYSELHNTGFRPMPVIDTSRPHDSSGIVLFLNDSGKTYYHPVSMFIFATRLSDLYHRTKEEHYHDMLLRYLDKLHDIAVTHDSAVFFPYRFDHFVHGARDMPLDAPWYSGMAQGTILGLYSRAFVATGDSSYLAYADSIFNSLLLPRGEFEPWVVFTDESGCFWIEEYPVDPPTKTLNGFIYALYGVYDYYQITKRPDAERILQRGLSTVKNYIPVYRIKGQSSLYELRSPYFDKKYHYVHLKQLRYLHRMTGDSFFHDWADSLEADTKQD